MLLVFFFDRDIHQRLFSKDLKQRHAEKYVHDIKDLQRLTGVRVYGRLCLEIEDTVSNHF